jgi:formamidopyrimidine-DNA glycosylase
MPELPEVENTRRYLMEIGLPGKTFTRANIGWSRSVRYPDLEDFVLGLAGRTVETVDRRGKYLLLLLNTGGTLVLHLGMTGGIRIHPKTQPAPSMVRHTLELEDGTELRFIDPRRFGHLWLVDDLKQAVPEMGPEPLDRGFSPEILARVLAGRVAAIKALLLEQSIIAGLGNLYADEALYLARIHPERMGSSLTPDEVARLKDAIVTALTVALAQYDQSRKAGWPDPPFGRATWTIPRKAGEPCVRCGIPMELIPVRSRSTYFCPGCQTL